MGNTDSSSPDPQCKECGAVCGQRTPWRSLPCAECGLQLCKVCKPTHMTKVGKRWTCGDAKHRARYLGIKVYSARLRPYMLLLLHLERRHWPIGLQSLRLLTSFVGKLPPRPPDGVCAITLTGHTGRVYCLTVMKDGRIASGSADGTVRLWQGGRCEATLRGHTQEVCSVAVLQNGDLASGSRDRTVRLWRDGQCEATLEHYDEGWRGAAVWSLCAMADGRLASASDYTVRLWRDGKCEATMGHPPIWRNGYSGHTDYVTCLVSCEQNGDLASGSSDMTVKLWRDGQYVATLGERKSSTSLAPRAAGHTENVTALAGGQMLHHTPLQK